MSPTMPSQAPSRLTKAYAAPVLLVDVRPNEIISSVDNSNKRIQRKHWVSKELAAVNIQKILIGSLPEMAAE